MIVPPTAEMREPNQKGKESSWKLLPVKSIARRDGEVDGEEEEMALLMTPRIVENTWQNAYTMMLRERQPSPRGGVKYATIPPVAGGRTISSIVGKNTLNVHPRGVIIIRRLNLSSYAV